MTSAAQLLWPSAIAFTTPLLLLAVMLRTGWGRRLALDQPNQRSLHHVAVPRVGGIAIVLGVLLSWSLVPGAQPALGLFTALLALISAVDDRMGLPVAVRLLAHLALALVCAVSYSLGDAGLTAALMLYLVWMANCYNFMDGADGLAGGMALFGFGAYGIAALLAGNHALAAMSLAPAAAAAAFLLFNFAPARVFMGDAGSISLGFVAAALGASGAQQRLWPLWFPLLVFSPFLVDAGVTLARRLWHRERFWQAHRQHYYQRLIRMGWSHRRTALAAYALMLGAAASALFSLTLGSATQLGLLGGWCLVYALLLRSIDARWRRSPLRSQQ